MFRIGLGFDSHPFEEEKDKPLLLGGVKIDFPKGLKGHSDGDVLLHAITDAILGALGEPDIGQLFPPSEEQWKNASSELFLKEAIRRMEMANYKILNLDCVIICDQPKIAPYKEKIIRSLGDLLKIHPWQISIKGKTREGFCSEEGIAVFCNVLLQKIQLKDV